MCAESAVKPQPTNQPIERFVPCVFTANIRGGFMQKADELDTVITENNVDIACITESAWVNKSTPSECPWLAYHVHRNDRNGGRRGGVVAVLVRQDDPCRLNIS